MTLLEVISKIENVARGQESVNMIVQNDVFRLNAKADARYGVFAWTQGVHRAQAGTDTASYSFTLFYIDRLTNDRANETEVQSVGIQTLDNIIRELDGQGVSAEPYTVQPFLQRFTDECAGVFASVTFTVPVETTCPEAFTQSLSMGGGLTAKEFIRGLELAASCQPSVRMVVENDIYRLNAKADARYGVFAWTQGAHRADINESLMQYSFNLFYVDRLTNDHANQAEIQSVGAETIGNIIGMLDEVGIGSESYTIQPFNERFTDECAGVFASVTFSVPVPGTCAELGHFSFDFNEDFMIY